MRADPATAITALALTAGLVVLVGVMAGTSARTSAIAVQELDPIRLEGTAHAVIGVDKDKFLLAADAPNVVIDAAAPATKPRTLNSTYWYGGDAYWEEGRSTLHLGGGGGSVDLDVSDWSTPQEKHPGSYISSFSYAWSAGVSYHGTYESQVYRVDGERTVEQKFNGGAVGAVAAVGASVVAYVRDRDDDKKGTLYLLDGDELTVLAQEPASEVKKLLAIDESHFLMLDGAGLHVGSVSGGNLSVRLEIEGANAVSRNMSGGCFVLSTTSTTRLMRLENGRLSTVKTLDHRPMVDAAFNDELLAVIYEKDKREVALYRLRL